MGFLRRLGGSIPGTVVRLVLISIVVGMLLSWFGFTPWQLFAAVRRMVETLVARGSGILGDLFNYFLVGAVIVVPVWLIMRLLKSAPRGRR